MFSEDEEKSVLVLEGDSVTLNSSRTEIMDDNLIHWRFEKYLIAELNKRGDSMTVYDDVLDGRFRDRLKLDKQTGSLIIADIRMKHAGFYKVENHNMSIIFILIVYGEYLFQLFYFLITTDTILIHILFCFFSVCSVVV